MKDNLTPTKKDIVEFLKGAGFEQRTKSLFKRDCFDVKLIFNESGNTDFVRIEIYDRDQRRIMYMLCPGNNVRIFLNDI